VIYDAAHAFGVSYKGKSILNYGDVSTCSFHATKLFHTGEGGAICCNDEVLYNTLFYLHNFGHHGPLDFYGLGINAKMSELQAAMGLAVLPYMETILKERQRVVEHYNNGLDFSKLTKLKIREHTQWNYSYYPVLFNSEDQLLKVEQALKMQQIIPRRYFYPGLNTLPYVSPNELPISDSVYKRVMCLPLYHDLGNESIELVIQIIHSTL
jgi:dTDP-4-amino-4,6-dideoxygalactose transaminase